MITANEFPIVVDKNPSGHYRGLHMVIINPFTGKVEFTQVFDTYKSSTEINEFIV